ncbi:Rho GTPase-activating protein 1-like protein [Drosera capensis]
MTEVLHSPSHFPSSPGTSENALFITQSQQPFSPNPNPSSTTRPNEGENGFDSGLRGGEVEELKRRREEEREELSLLTLLVAVFRKSLIACKADREELCGGMEIGWPTNVRHVAHVTFDRFNGFLGLPVEFEPDVPRRAPSASTSVFGVSTESMQLSFDSRGNCVPTILILMQRRLYAQGGLQAEGIFRINAENSQEEFVRDGLNRGIIPENIDVHCLAGLIKAWFRELPSGVLDPLSPEDVMQSESEEDYTELVRLLPPTEAALLDWAINLMADVVQQEQFNKMNAHNIAMVFAPNMTQMADPLTALMYAVQVMNFLKTLIMKTLREREDSRANPAPAWLESSDESDQESPSEPRMENCTASGNEETENEYSEHCLTDDEPVIDSSHDSIEYDAEESDDSPFQLVTLKVPSASFLNGSGHGSEAYSCEGMKAQSSSANIMKETFTTIGQIVVAKAAEMDKSLSKVARTSSRMERIEAWR